LDRDLTDIALCFVEDWIHFPQRMVELSETFQFEIRHGDTEWDDMEAA
jgi:hypothetical protein